MQKDNIRGYLFRLSLAVCSRSQLVVSGPFCSSCAFKYNIWFTARKGKEWKARSHEGDCNHEGQGESMSPYQWGWGMETFFIFFIKMYCLVHFESYLNVTITRKWSVLTPREPEIRWSLSLSKRQRLNLPTPVKLHLTAESFRCPSHSINPLFAVIQMGCACFVTVGAVDCWVALNTASDVCLDLYCYMSLSVQNERCH